MVKCFKVSVNYVACCVKHWQTSARLMISLVRRLREVLVGSAATVGMRVYAVNGHCWLTICREVCPKYIHDRKNKSKKTHTTLKTTIVTSRPYIQSTAVFVPGSGSQSPSSSLLSSSLSPSDMMRLSLLASSLDSSLTRVQVSCSASPSEFGPDGVRV